MKKLITIFLALNMALAMTACTGSANEPNSKEPNSNSSSQAQQESSKEDDKKTDEQYQTHAELPGTLEVYETYAHYKIDVPNENRTDRASIGYINKTENYFVASGYYNVSGTESYGIDIKDIKEVKDVMTVLAKQSVENIREGLIFAETYTLNIDNQELKTVNGWEMSRFTGSVHLDYSKFLAYEDAKLVGYSVIKDGYPIYFAVVDSSRDQSQDINEMTALADKIATTFRNCELD